MAAAAIERVQNIPATLNDKRILGLPGYRRRSRSFDQRFRRDELLQGQAHDNTPDAPLMAVLPRFRGGFPSEP